MQQFERSILVNDMVLPQVDPELFSRLNEQERDLLIQTYNFCYKSLVLPNNERIDVWLENSSTQPRKIPAGSKVKYVGSSFTGRDGDVSNFGYVAIDKDSLIETLSLGTTSFLDLMSEIVSEIYYASYFYKYIHVTSSNDEKLEGDSLSPVERAKVGALIFRLSFLRYLKNSIPANSQINIGLLTHLEFLIGQSEELVAGTNDSNQKDVLDRIYQGIYNLMPNALGVIDDLIKSLPIPVLKRLGRSFAKTRIEISREKETYEGILIEGDKRFIEKTKQALLLLKSTSQWHTVKHYIKMIVLSDHSGINVESGVFEVSVKTAYNGRIHYASDIAHDAFHVYIYNNDERTEEFPTPWSGSEAERRCIDFQIVVLIAIRESNPKLGFNIDWLIYKLEQIKYTTKHHEVPEEHRFW